MPEINLSTITFTNRGDTVYNEYGPPSGNVVPNQAASLRNTSLVNTLGGSDSIIGSLIADAPSGENYPNAKFYGIDLERSLETSSGNDRVAGNVALQDGVGLSQAYGIDLTSAATRIINLSTSGGNDVVEATVGVQGENIIAAGIFGKVLDGTYYSRIVTGAGDDRVNVAAAADASGDGNAVAAGGRNLLVNTDSNGAAGSDADFVSFVSTIAGDLNDGRRGSSFGLDNSRVVTGASNDVVHALGSGSLSGDDLRATALGLSQSTVSLGSGDDQVHGLGSLAIGEDDASSSTDVLDNGNARAVAAVDGQGQDAGEARSTGILGSTIDGGAGDDLVVGIGVAVSENLAEAEGIRQARILTGDGNDAVYGVASAGAGSRDARAEAAVDVVRGITAVGVATNGTGDARAVGIERSFIDTGSGDDIVHAGAVAGAPLQTQEHHDILRSDIRLGTGDDIIYATSVDLSNLAGGAGNDRFDILSGVDTIVNGGDGRDALVLVGDFDLYDFDQTGYGVLVESANASVPETDLRVSDVEQFIFADKTVAFDDLFA